MSLVCCLETIKWLDPFGSTYEVAKANTGCPSFEAGFLVTSVSTVVFSKQILEEPPPLPTSAGNNHALSIQSGAQ